MKRMVGGGVKAVVMLAALALILLAVGCGQDGKIYGFLEWDYDIYAASVGGFPSYVNWDQYYEVKGGTHSVLYTLYDSSGGHYYPSWYVYGYNDSTMYWQFTYTVEADSGSFPFVDGKDHHFGLLLGYDGLYIAGDAKQLATQRAMTTGKAGTRSWSQDGLRITVTGAPVALTQDQVSRLARTRFVK